VIGTKATRHVPNCLIHDSGSDELQTMDQAITGRATHVRGDGSKAE
jgi:hypothetical protein